MKRIYILYLFLSSLVASTPLKAQLERSNWVFGDKGFMQFEYSSTCASVDRSGSMFCEADNRFNVFLNKISAVSTTEGTSSISSFDGNLLFYTDGLTVWNKNHQIMANGEDLNGSQTSSQGSLIVPLPNSCNEYYVFTITQGEDLNNFYYSKVDMNGDDNLGVVTEKNILIQNNVTERVTAVFHQNVNDYWIIVHEANSDAFYAYLLDANGLSSTPVISRQGSVHEGTCGSIGYMRGSKNSQYIATTIANCAQATQDDRVELFSFNSLIGSLRYLRKYDIPNAYGVEFSSNSEFLYVANWHGGLIHQLGLSLSTQRTVGRLNNFGPNGINNSTGSLLRGNDGNIYASINNTNSIGQVGNADKLFEPFRLECDSVVSDSTAPPPLVPDTVSCVQVPIPLPFGIFTLDNSMSRFGLPNLVPEPPITKEIIGPNGAVCKNQFASFVLSDNSGIDSVQWNFEDGFQATGFQVSHRLDEMNNVSCVRATLFKCGLFYDIHTCHTTISCIKITQESSCEDFSVQFNVNNSSSEGEIVQAAWSFSHGFTTSEINPLIIFPGRGIYRYSVRFTWSDGFEETKEGDVIVDDVLSVNLGPDMFVCKEDSGAYPITLSPQVTGLGTYRWQDDSDSSLFVANGPGTYWVEYINPGGCVERDSIQIEEFSLVTLPQEITVCFPDTQIIDLSFLEADSVIWQDGTLGPLYPVSEAGIYGVRLVKGVCEVFDSIQVSVEEPPFLDQGQDTTVCEADFLLLNAFIPQALSYTWQDGSTGPFFTATETGIYKVQIQTENCLLEDSIQVVFIRTDELPDQLGCDDAPITINAFIPGATYLWQDGSVNPSFLADTAGTYWVEISRDGCTVRDSIEIDYDPALSLDLGPDSLLCFDEDIILDVTQAGATYTWADGFMGPVRQITQSGTYTVTLDRGACSITDSVQIDILNLDLGADNSYCTSDTLVLNAFNPGATYLWQDGSTDSVFLATESGQYFVQVSRDGCVLSDTVNIELIIPPSVNLGPDTLLCESQILTLDAFIEDASFRWQDGSTNPIFEVSESGIYWVDVIRGGGCVVRDSIEVEIVDVDLGPDQIACGDSVFTLSAYSPGATYFWSDGSRDSVLTVTQTGTYWVEVFKENCLVYDTVQITIESAPVLELGPDTVLCDENLLFDISQNGAQYLWQDGSTSPQFTVSESGTYWARKNIGLCEISDTVEVVIVKADLGPDRIECINSTVVLDAFIPLPDVSYLWQDGSNLPFFEVDQPGEYWVEVAYQGCIRRDTVNIDFTLPPEVSLGADTVLCEGSLSLDVSYPGASYLWQDGSTDSVFTITKSGTYSVTLGIGNCTRSDEIRVDILQVDLGPDRSVCNDELVVLDASQSLPGATYRWQDGSTNPVFLVNQSGLYWVEIAYQACVIRDSVEIDLVNPPLANLGADTLLCEGDMLSLNLDQPGASFLWQDGSKLPTFDISGSGLFWVEVRVDDCIRRDTLFVEQLELELGPDLTLCQGESQRFNVFQEGASYLWQDGSQSPFYIADTAGTYWVEISKENCVVRDSLTLNFTQEPQIELGPSDTLLLCGESLLLDASQEGAAYLWQDGSSDPQFLVNRSGLYTVEVRRGNCLVSEQIFVQFPFLGELELGPDSSICQDSPYTLRAPQAGSSLPVTYLWSTGSEEAEIEVEQAGTYWVAISSEGCTQLDTVNLDFVNCEIFIPGTEFFVPNVITPNGDGKNDAFGIDGINLTDWSLRIYNRWGNLVYETLDYKNNWSAQGETAGTYYYQLAHPRLEEPFRGWILVMK